MAEICTFDELINVHNKACEEFKKTKYKNFNSASDYSFHDGHYRDYKKSKYNLDHIKNNKIIIDIISIKGETFISKETYLYQLKDNNFKKYMNSFGNTGNWLNRLLYESYDNKICELFNSSIIFNTKIIKITPFLIGDLSKIGSIGHYFDNFENIVELNIIIYNPKDHISPDLTSIIGDLKTQISELKNEINDIKSKNETQILKLKNEITNIQFKNINININNNQKNKEPYDMIKLNDYQ